MPTMPSQMSSALSGGLSSQPAGSLDSEGKSRWAMHSVRRAAGHENEREKG